MHMIFGGHSYLRLLGKKCYELLFFIQYRDFFNIKIIMGSEELKTEKLWYSF